MTAYAPTDVQLHPLESATLPDILNASVEFGVLQSNGNCTNIGICRINTTHVNHMVNTRKEKRRCPLAEALLSVGPTGRLQIFFPRSGMKPCTERVFFRGPVFPVQVAYLLPESLQKQLPGLMQAVIPTGIYPIRRSDEGYYIEF
ncbi:MAG: hypothetical protein R3D58_14520 [Saprospiraceae bacterium]